MKRTYTDKNKHLLKFASLGLAALGFAMLPVAGVFAETGDGVMSFRETTAVTVSNTCGIYTSYSIASDGTVTKTDVTAPDSGVQNAYSKTMVAGETWSFTSADTSGTGGNAYTYRVVCNNTNGWEIKAVGSGAGTSVDLMDASTGADDDIVSAATYTDADTAASWAFKIATVGTGVTNDNNNTYAVIPTTATRVIHAEGATDSTTGTFTTGYRVHIGTQTPAGTYTGAVTYTLSHPLSVSQDNQTSETPSSDPSEPSSSDPVEDNNTDNTDNTDTNTDPSDTSSEEPQSSPKSNSLMSASPSVVYVPQSTSTSSPQVVYVPTSQTSGSNDNASTPSANANTTDTNDGMTNPLGMSTSTGAKSSSSPATTSSTGSDNTGLIVALGVTAAAAAASAGAYLYTKSKE